MIPNQKHADDGRINPRGIAYLYLADSVETAIAEVRPLKDEAVTVGLFSLRAACDVIDCRDRDGQDAGWSDINSAMRFSAGREDTWRIYLPTQCIAEHFRSEGYKGLLYGSAMNNTGYNIALFDIGAAQLNCSRLLRVRGVTYRIERDSIFADDIPSSQPLEYVDHDNLDLD
jgi:RES domain-containing protein